MLASKVNIHDNFGRCVLATRRWLTAELPDQPVEEILDVWSDVLNKINNDSISEERTDSDMQRELEDAAAVLGCAIYFEGTLPQERHTAYLILTAVREAVTNAVRHAGASQVTVRLREDGGFVFACITDNGEKRVSRITEGGGLSGLRKKIERAGGRLEIVLCGGVQLRVSLPLPKGAG